MQEGATDFTEIKVYSIAGTTSEDTNADLNIGKRPNQIYQLTAKIYCFQVFRSYFTIAQAKLLPWQCE